jgi:hypothetical protein
VASVQTGAAVAARGVAWKVRRIRPHGPDEAEVYFELERAA